MVCKVIDRKSEMNIKSSQLSFSFVIFLLFFSNVISTQSQPFEIKIWPNGAPQAINHNKLEVIENRNIEQNEFGLNRSISNVNEPTLFVHLAQKERLNGTAILIFPGGGYNRIVIDKEGHDVARWLNSNGITGIVVKYRTAPEGIKVRGVQTNYQIRKAILSDAIEAIKIVRENSNKWNIDSTKIGLLGFSAGGHLCALLCSNIQTQTDNNFSSIPKFVGLIYPVLENDFNVSNMKNFPSTFIVSARDDKTSPPENILEFYNHLQHNSISAVIHLYQTGGHGFGLGVRGGEVSTWKDFFIDWLKTSNFL